MAKRAAARLTISEVIAEASDFSRDAWRACWLPILLVTAGHALQFLHGNMAAGEWRPGVFGFLAYVLMIFYVPLYGGLYRIAIGGRPAAGLRFGGLQWNGVEWRLVAVAVVIAFLVGLSLTPFLAAMGVLYLVFGSHRVVSFGPLGSFSYLAMASIPVWLLFVWLMAPRIARLMLGWAYSTAREKTEPFAGWEPAKRSGWPIACVLALAWVPLLLGYLVVYALTLVEGDALLPNAWPLPEALGAGVLLGALRAAVVAPLLVGAITGAFWLLEERDAVAANDHPIPPPQVHGEAYPPGDAFPHEDAAAAASALAAQQAAELDLPPSEVDHNLTEPPALHEPEAPELESHEPESHEPGVHGAEAAPPPELHAAEADHAQAAPEAAASVAAAEPAAPEHGTPEHAVPEHEAAEPAPDHHEHHAGLAHALEAAAAVAAVAAAAALAAHEAHKAHEAHEAEADRAKAAHGPEPEPEPAHAPEAPPEAPHEPEPPHAAEPEQAVAEAPPAPAAASTAIGPLSPWPHSVLPPWPVRDTAAGAAIVPAEAPPAAAGPESPPGGGGESFPPLARAPLAHQGEPAHRFVEITELK